MEIMIESLKAKAVALQTRKATALKVAEPTGLEPATSDVTGRRSNQLNYDSAGNSNFQKCGKLQFVAEVRHDKLKFVEPLLGRHGGTRTPNLFLVREAVYH